MMGFPEGFPLAGVVTADAMAAKPETNAAVVKYMLAACNCENLIRELCCRGNGALSNANEKRVTVKSGSVWRR
jgi:hypothetical protein